MEEKGLGFCFVFNPSCSFWEISVKKVLTFVIAGMQPHCALIEVSRKDSIDLLFYESQISMMSDFEIQCIFCQYECSFWCIIYCG